MEDKSLAPNGDGLYTTMKVTGGGITDTGHSPSLEYARAGKWWNAFRTGERQGTGILRIPPRLVIAREQDYNSW